MGLIALGFITAFVVAIPVVKGLIGFVGRYGLTPFAWYPHHLRSRLRRVAVLRRLTHPEPSPPA